MTGFKGSLCLLGNKGEMKQMRRCCLQQVGLGVTDGLDKVEELDMVKGSHVLKLVFFFFH